MKNTIMPKPAPDPLLDNHVKPEPKLEKRTRRTFNAEYKLRTVQEANACQHGELERNPAPFGSWVDPRRRLPQKRQGYRRGAEE